MSDVIIPMEAVQYLGIVQAVLYFVGATCLCFAVVAIFTLLQE